MPACWSAGAAYPNPNPDPDPDPNPDQVSRHQLGPSATEHSAPLYKFSFSSISNIVSSVSQYEALKYVSFPTQVVAQSC